MFPRVCINDAFIFNKRGKDIFKILIFSKNQKTVYAGKLKLDEMFYRCTSQMGGKERNKFNSLVLKKFNADEFCGMI